MNHLPWDVGISTDRSMRMLFKRLSYQYADLEFYYPNDWTSGIIPVLKHIYKAVKYRLFPSSLKKEFRIKRENLVSRKEFLKQDFDLIYSQAIIPIGVKKNTPLLLDLFFIDPEHSHTNVTEISKVYWKRLVKDMERVANMSCIINLRSDYSLRLVEKYFPENRHKFVNLPFLLPDLKPLSLEYVFKKHTNVSLFKIAFIGAQAIRKGLPLLVMAIDILYNKRNFRNLELNIVSGCTDGNIYIPSNLPIICHGKMNYERTMDILKMSHIYVMPSYYESFGLSYVEAMANGCIVLARNFEPQREIVDYGKAGLLVDLNANDIADKLQQVLEMKEKERKCLVLKGYERFKEKYEFSVVSKKWYREFARCASMNKE